jgi:hypothetical protein
VLQVANSALTAGPDQRVAPPSFMVFFYWDRSNLSQQALTTIQQAANAFKAKGSARITATGHTDTSGPESYNMALSLRRANAVKDALVRDGVPAQAITVVGMGGEGPVGADRRQRARAAEPPRRDRHPVGFNRCTDKGGLWADLDAAKKVEVFSLQGPNFSSIRTTGNWRQSMGR